MLDNETKRRIDTARDILVGKVPDPKSQVEQITIALIYKFMDDMDAEAEELGGKRKFFSGKYERFGWKKLMSPSLGGHEVLSLYAEAIQQMNINANIPQLFRDIFKNAFLPYRDPETLKSFLKTIDEFEYDHSEKLGDAFEYLLSVLGSQGDAGQFRTPRHIIDFMVHLVDPKKNETILYPACGTAGFLISSYKHIVKTNSKNYKAEQESLQFGNGNGERYNGDKLTPDQRKQLATNIKGYDISPDMVRLSLVNLYLHGFADPKIVEYDTLTSDEKWNEHADIILANPPFMSPKGGIKPHKRFSIESSRSEVLFVDYIAEHLTPNGRAAVIVPEGIIFQSGTAYKSLRKMLVEKYLYAVVSLPAGVFNPYSGVKTSILLIDKTFNKKTDKILFAKIENDGFDLGAQRRPNNKSELPEIARAVKEFVNCVNSGKDFNADDFTKLVVATKEKIGENGEWNLSGERYKTSLVKSIIYNWMTLKDLTEFMQDGNWIESKDQSEGGIRLIQTGNVGIGEYLDKADKSKFISEDTFIKLKCTEVFEGDVLISRLPDPVGRACIVPKLGFRTITAVDCSIIRFNENKMLSKLYVNYTKSDKYYEQLRQYLTGASRERISRSNLEQVQIPVPPLEVQKEIVSEIESYQKIIDGAQQVVENYKPHIQIDPEWEMVELGEVCEVKNGYAFRSEDFVENGIQLIRLGNVKNNLFDVQNNQVYLPEHFREKYASFLLHYGDVIISMTGTTGKTDYGNVCMINQHQNYFLNQRVGKIIFKSDRINKKYLLFISSLEYFKNLIFRNSAGGVRQANISAQQIENIKIPVPSIEVQDEIVKNIDTELSIVDKNSELITIFEQKIKNKIASVWGE